jgi:lysozyme
MKIPQLSVSEINKIIEANKIPKDLYPVVLVAIRGYYLDSVGAVGKNDRRVFDDAHFLVWPDGVGRFLANTDPNGYREGQGTSESKKGIATLQTGVWIYGTGLHKGRKAFRQCEPVTVWRDGIGGKPYKDTGHFAIDIHDAHGDEDSIGATDSLGCQTQPREVFLIFQPFFYNLLNQYKNKISSNDRDEPVRSFPYVLIEETERRKGNLVVSERFF